MSYAVVRVQKFSAGSVKGIEMHDRREKDHSNTNPDIDYTKSENNYDLHSAQHNNFRRAVNERISQLDLPKAVRKDAVVMAQVLVTSDSVFFDNLEYQDNITKDFFTKAYDFLADRYGRENVISATVHMDERTPHMHFNFVPVTSDGRLSAKSILTRQTLTEQQDAFFQNVGKEFNLQRGELKDEGKRRTHLETSEYKIEMEKLEKARAERNKLTEESLKAYTALIKAQELNSRIKSLADEERALQSKIEGLQGQIEDLELKNETIQIALRKDTAVGIEQFTVDGMKERIEIAKKEIEQERRLSLFERFIQLPAVKPLWDKFMNFIDKNKDKNRFER